MEKLLKSRRSIRKYLNKDIEQEKIDEMIKCSLLSFSSMNSKPWKIYYTSDKNKIEKLSIAKDSGSRFIADAPLVMAICANPNLTGPWIEDASIMATILHLKVHEMGLGSCWIQIRGRKNNENMSASDFVKEVLDIEQEYEVLCLMSIGYKGEEKSEYSDKNILFERAVKR